MKLLNLSKLFFIILIVFALISCGKEQERTVTEKEVPQAVLQAFNSTYPGATINEYAEEKEDGRTVYEISCEFESRKIDAIYNPNGTIYAIEEVIPADALPDVILQAIAKEFQQFSIELTEEIEKEGKQLFEVKLLNTKDQKRYELLFSGDGKLVEKEKIGKDEEE